LRGPTVLLVALFATTWTDPADEQREALLEKIREVHGLDDARMEAIARLFSASSVLGQGNPAVAVHPMTPAECRAKPELDEVRRRNPRFEKICGARFMAPLYDPEVETAEDSRSCIDQFEFPDIPCEYPVVWVRAREAALLCEAMGKRLCDAHEWEGACAGSLEAPDYAFESAKGLEPGRAVGVLRAAHNRIQNGKKVWSYGPEYRGGICAASSFKTPGCGGGSWTKCGSNTFPAGAFPSCRSTLGVYDLHGNAAEHMNLPLAENQMASRGSREYGYTEMKGSWFIFDSYKAHEDACRWRAPFWHGSRVMDPGSHHNYHLGFRCCKTVDGD
jgi:formylglycine-generating enzyme required for sulfatase activity